MVNDSNYHLLSKNTDFIPLADQIHTTGIGQWGTHQKDKLPLSLKGGCYKISFKPNYNNFIFLGTMRIDKYANTISGDFYKFIVDPYDWKTNNSRITSNIPIYPRNQYYSYLKVTGISTVTTYSNRQKIINLQVEEYNYAHPPEGYNGSFSKNPSRKFTVILSNINTLYGGPTFIGKLIEDGVDKGEFRMNWISPFYRSATLVISTTPGATAPRPVKAKDWIGTESFRTIFTSAGWDLHVIYNPERISPPPNTTTLTGNKCPSEADLHALLSSMNIPSGYLDQDWQLQLLVVPGTMGCSRGVLFDNNRKGAASFSNDGYPKEDSENFGTATGKQQWQVPRAFLRSAAHEVGHGFNQQHQYLTEFGEPGSDNSIMTTTPEVAKYIANPPSGRPGVFPDDINLRFNDHVRHHLIHFPDPVVRPGGMDFQAGHINTVPEANQSFASDKLELRLKTNTKGIKLGEPLNLTWELVNNDTVAIPTPTDIRIEAQHTKIRVINPKGELKPMPSFVIQTDAVCIQDLEPGRKLEAKTLLYWSTKGFAFDTPGKHTIEVQILWNYRGKTNIINAKTDIWVDYPLSEADNTVASLLLNDEVGRYVALGGGAYHLERGVNNIERAISEYENHPACLIMKTLLKK